MKSERTLYEYECDNCKRLLDDSCNSLTIVTVKSADSFGWSRLRVTIQYHFGVHNEAKIREADLCQDCAELLLKDALDRVKLNERASAGVEEIKSLSFNSMRSTHRIVKNS